MMGAAAQRRPVSPPLDHDRLGGRFATAELPSVVLHGRGALNGLGDEFERAGGERAVLLTTGSVGRDGRLTEQVRDSLGVRVVAVFDGCGQHTPERAVAAAVTAVRSARADTVLTLGGGSVVDTGKQVVRRLAGHGVRRHIALPTTLAGSEHTAAAAVTTANGQKCVRRDAVMAPSVVVIDPALTVATPRRLWASSGVKVISDAVEQLCSVHASPLVDVLATRAVADLAVDLPASLDGDLDARLRCQLAAWMCMYGMFGAGVLGGLAAGLRHQLAPRHDLPHGLVGSALLPAAVRALLPTAPKARLPLSQALGALDATTEGIAAGVGALLDALELPRSLTAIGLGRDDVRAVADAVFADLVTAGNPLPVDSPEALAMAFADEPTTAPEGTVPRRVRPDQEGPSP
ncbi:MAG: iron-containing alcohol dehydrogenase [Propionibacteriales bacterium]|nr:iron-containing alcohol dehydrogenase [Propionibacteriales bacterium]